MTQESPDMLLHHPTVQNTVFFMSWGSCTTCLHRVALTCGLCKAAEGVFRVALLTMLWLPPAEGGGRGLGLPGQVYGHNLGLQVGHEVQLSQQTPRDPIVICVLNNKPCIWDEEKQSVWLCRAERGQFILCSGAANSHPVLRPSDKHPGSSSFCGQSPAAKVTWSPAATCYLDCFHQTRRIKSFMPSGKLMIIPQKWQE